ncbi:Hemolysin A [hydrothermal vent metagenome]|uniref:Hemolysin A n=1 Tax=hydrothermal vent metagenome TaxID=652676 RepID=A0A3B0V8U8_9ZZZZ
METIISPVSKELLLSELNEKTFLRKTNSGGNEIYDLTAEEAPHIMLEIGRLRELTFRDAKGGTGKSVDIDEYDKGEDAFRQLIVWDPKEQALVGGYRYKHCKEMKVKDGEVFTPTSRLFKYNKLFIEKYLPYTIELGRSFVQPDYQPTYNLRRGLFSLDNLWDGLGAVMVKYADAKYLFGKITMYPHFDSFGRDMILYFMQKYFPDKEGLITPRNPLPIKTDRKILESIFSGVNYEENYRILVQKVRKLGENIPPLFNAYMSLSSTMKTFGTALNDHFGNVEETGILVTVEDIYGPKKDRHLVIPETGR